MGRDPGALATLATTPFEVAFDTLDGTMLRGARGSTGAAAFHREVAQHLITGGLYVPPQGFWLHLSLAYCGPGHHRAAIMPIAWHADQFLMVRSIPRVGHQIMGRWPLIDPQLGFAL